MKTMKRTILILLTALLSTAPLLAQYSPCYEAAFVEGKRLYNAGKYAQAKKYFNEAKDCPDPNTVAVKEWVGKCDAKIQAQKAAATEKKQQEEAARVAAEKKQQEEAKKMASQLIGDGNCNGYEYIDLGLPSGTLWATCNVGASKPTDYGDYFSWGETETKNYYWWSTYELGGYDHLKKYCNLSERSYNKKADNLSTLQPCDDAAVAKWGNGWCIPTKTQWEELLNNTTNIWTTCNDVRGQLFTAKNGKSIFLPAAGDYCDDKIEGLTSDGSYWSSLISSTNPGYAWFLSFSFLGKSYMLDSTHARYRGHSIRPVRTSNQ